MMGSSYENLLLIFPYEWIESRLVKVIFKEQAIILVSFWMKI